MCLVSQKKTTNGAQATDPAQVRRDGAYFQQIFDAAPGAIVVLDGKDRVCDANPSFLRLFGFRAKDEVLGQAINQLIVPPERWSEASEASRRTIGGECVVQRTVRRRRDGTLVEVLGFAVPFHPRGGNLGVYVTFYDVGPQCRAERALKREKEIAQGTLHALGEAVIRTDDRRRICDMNPAAEALTGWGRTEAIGRRLRDVFQIEHEHTRKPAPDPVPRALREGITTEYSDSHVLIGRDGREARIEHSAAPLRDRNGQIIGSVLAFRDITERRRMQEEIQYRASHDILTGLYNRHVFEQALARTLRDRRSASRHSTLLYLDLNDFKRVNDTWGHAVGDALLRQIGRRLKGWVREQDLVSRLGGDEFGVILADCTKEEAVRRVETLLGGLREEPFSAGGQVFRVKASVGVVGLSGGITDVERALTMADSACYQAKAERGVPVHVYSEDDGLWPVSGATAGSEGPDNDPCGDASSLQASSLHIARSRGAETAPSRRSAADDGFGWVSRLGELMELNRIEIYRQEIVPIGAKSGAKRRWESLLRVRDFSGEPVDSAAFIRAIEWRGLSSALDRWVCGRVFAYLRNRHDSEPLGIVDINLLGPTLGDPEFLEFLGDHLGHNELSSGNEICFDISESEAGGNARNVKAFIRVAHELGCTVALDDFSGSAFQYSDVAAIGFDYVKFARPLIADVGTNPFFPTVMDAVHRLAGAARPSCIAKGVESADTLVALQKVGVCFGQGFALHQPEPWLDASGKAAAG